MVEIVQMVAVSLVSAVLQVLIMVSLYHFWIIPAILKGVKNDLGVAVSAWIGDATTKISVAVSANIEELLEKVKSSFMGRRGNAARQEQLARRFLSANLPEDYDPETETEPDEMENIQGVINEAITRYGANIVRALLADRGKKAAPEPEKPNW